jgi:lysophospholipase L1-like esterase
LNAIPLVLIVVGIGIIGADIYVDTLWGNPGFGPLQIGGIMLGASLVALGVVATFRRGRFWLKRLLMTRTALVVFGTCFGLLAAEATLRLLDGVIGEASYHAEIEELSERVADPHLGYAMPANAFGHDANGFRNETVPDRSDIVALGDSWTWGVNAKRRQAWPARLSALTERGVYNMGMGGFGPPQYWYLARQAKRFQPRLVLIGLYTGNDIADAANNVYTLDAYNDFRKPGHVKLDGAATITQKLTSIRKKAETLKARIMAEYARDHVSGWLLMLHRYSAMARLLARFDLLPGLKLEEVEIVAEKSVALSEPAYSIVIDDGVLRTILHPAERFLPLNLGDPHIQEGMALTKQFLRQIRTLLRDGGIKMMVLLLPSKELGFADIALSGGHEANETYAEAIRMETTIRKELMRFLKEQGIAVADVLPVMRGSLDKGIQIFPKDSESHPNPAGYDLIAKTAQRKLLELGW